MPAFLILSFRFLRSTWSGMKDSNFRSLFYWVAGFLALGTWFS